MNKLTFTTGGGDFNIIRVEEHACDSLEDGTEGHLYHLNGLYSLGDLATLVRLLQMKEAPDISAMDWARLSSDDNCELYVGDLEEEALLEESERKLQ